MPDAPQTNEAVKVFYSYAHEDEDLRKRLDQHFSFLKREKKIAAWYDGEIKAGEEWLGEIEAQLNSADVILLLISAAFADSDFCYSIEMNRAMERHDAGEAVVVPILLHPCDWKNAPFAKLQALPGGDEAISEWDNTEKALYEVARGVRETVEELIAKRYASPQPSPAEDRIATAAQVPPPPAIDFVQRKDRDGNNIVERLRRELTQSPRRLVVLWGDGGVGKTTIAAEVTRALSGIFGERIVWASAEKRADFNYSTLLNDIAIQLGGEELTKLAIGPKEQAITRLIAAAPTLVVLDNFETISPDERNTCADFLATRAQCPALITTRERVSHDAARHIHIESMDDQEARQFVERWVGQEAHDPRAFEGLDYNEIIRAADARPYVLQWVLAQIDLAVEPNAALDEISRAEGEVAERVFKRSFELPQLGEDGRDTLLALSLFTPDASRAALAKVTGFGDDLNRLNEAVKRLAALRLVETISGGRRLTVEGLTRSLAQSRLSVDERANGLRRRYVVYFVLFAINHAQRTPEDLDALESEKDNLLAAMDVAYAMHDWKYVMHISDALTYLLYLRGYWDEVVESGELAKAAAREAKDEKLVVSFGGDVALVLRSRGEWEEAKKLYLEGLEIFRKLGDEKNVAVELSELGVIAQQQGDLDGARRLYVEALDVSKKNKNGDQQGVARALHQLGHLAQMRGKIRAARRLYRNSLKVSRETGDLYIIANTLCNLATVTPGEPEEKRKLYDESFEISRRLGDQSLIAITLANLGLLKEQEGDKAEAERLLTDALRIFERLGSPEAAKARNTLARVKGESG
jgi:tetratricopeptide (TPR) repeat protein